MRYTPEFLDELRARLPVSHVVGRRVKLKKAGREWKGLSPFNQEKTPSFTVNDQKGFYQDFSSGKHGDIFSFVMETEGVSFPEAVERLAGIAGVPMPKASKEAAAQEARRKTLYEIIELAAKFFEATLASRAGAVARGYLADRGISPATQLRFRLGYASNERFALKEHLGKQGVSVGDMIEAGLLISGDDIPVPFDRFRERVMFPITDLRGRTIAFGGRALAKDVAAKYLNSPETPLFHKGSNLYNGAAARAAAHQGESVIAVEGYVDVIAMVTAGFPAAVAPLGTALTEEQLGLLWKMADEPILCFDGDTAGRRAAYRAVDLALPRLSPGKSLRFALLPEGQDPDDLVRSGGRGALAEVLGAARPLAEVLWQRETEAGAFDTPERRAALEARIGEIAGSIAHEAVRKYYRQDLQDRLGLLFTRASGKRDTFGRKNGGRPGLRHGRQRGGKWQQPTALGNELLTARSPRLQTSSLVRGFKTRLPTREALILMAVVNHPVLLETHVEEFAAIEFLHPDAGLLRRAILDAVHDHETPDTEAIRADIAARGLSGVLARVENAITHASDWPARADAAEDDVAEWWRHIITLHHKAGTLNKELKEAELALGEEPSEAHFAWLRDVQQRLAELGGTEALIEGFGASSGRSVRSF
jgi:DNA primase